MRLFGLIGYPLQHSFSPEWFRDKFEKENIDAEYQLFPIRSISEFPPLMEKHPRLEGVNVTIPYKQDIIPFLDDIRDEALSVKAVNTVAIENRVHGSKKSIGYNTDVYGFEQSVKPLIKPHHRKALILGTGGSSKTVAYVLNRLGLEVLFVSRRTPEDEHTIGYNELSRQMIQEYKVIINTTPLGMYPKVASKPEIPYEGIDKDHLLYDLVYNPSTTTFLEEGRKRSAALKNGYQMLCLQAERSWQIWNAAV
mgnify:CR=1 FL=1